MARAAARDEVTDTAADAAIEQACRILRLPTIRERHGEIPAAASRQQASYKVLHRRRVNACPDPLAAAVRTVRTVADEPKRATGRRDARSRQPERPEGVPRAAVRIKPLTEADVASAVELAVRVLRVKPGDRGQQFAADITGERWQMFVAKADQRVVAYGRVLELAPTGCSM